MIGNRAFLSNHDAGTNRTTRRIGWAFSLATASTLSMCLLASELVSQQPKNSGTIEFDDGKTLRFTDFERFGESPAYTRSVTVRYENTNRNILFAQVKRLMIVEWNCTPEKEQVTAEIDTRTGIHAPVNDQLFKFQVTIKDELTGQVKPQIVDTVVCSKRFGGPKRNIRSVTFDN